jgi:hypothetical protein
MKWIVGPNLYAVHNASKVAGRPFHILLSPGDSFGMRGVTLLVLVGNEKGSFHYPAYMLAIFEEAIGNGMIPKYVTIEDMEELANKKEG